MTFQVGDFVTLQIDENEFLQGVISLNVAPIYRFETIYGQQLWAHETALTPATIEPKPLVYKSELARARMAYGQGAIAHETLRRAAQNYIDAIKAYGRQQKKRTPVPSIAKLLR
jgi:hypothetical protein